MTAEFNARRARAKRPCPLWVDAFLRDTQHLAADEIGAYMLILMAMWTRETCDLPDDDHRLAKVARVSSRLWTSRIGAVIRPFLTVSGPSLISKRLSQEAGYVETQLTKQSGRRLGVKENTHTSPYNLGASDHSQQNDINPANPLKDNEPTASVDNPGIIRGTHHPNNPTLREEVGAAAVREARPNGINPDELLFEVMAAVGIKSGRTPTHWMPPAATIEVSRWVWDLGLTPDEIIDAARQSRARHAEAPSGPKALENTMRRLAAAKALPPLTPSPSTTGRSNDRKQFDHAVDQLADSLSSGSAQFSDHSRNPFAA